MSSTSVYNWIKLYGSYKQKGERIVIEKESEAKKNRSLATESFVAGTTIKP